MCLSVFCHWLMFKYHLPLVDMHGHKGGGGFGFEFIQCCWCLLLSKIITVPLSLLSLFMASKLQIINTLLEDRICNARCSTGFTYLDALKFAHTFFCDLKLESCKNNLMHLLEIHIWVHEMTLDSYEIKACNEECCLSFISDVFKTIQLITGYKNSISAQNTLIS